MLKQKFYTELLMKLTKIPLLLILTFSLGLFSLMLTAESQPQPPLADPNSDQAMPIAIVIHGGAGTITKENMTPELEQQYKAALKQALVAGYHVLINQGSSQEAVKTAIVMLEDSPLFNAGKGAVFTHDEKNSLDASIMVGSDLSAGAVAGVENIKNPILLADKIRTDSVHVMMSGKGAEEFAASHKIEQVDPKYFYTERRWKSLQQAKAKDASQALVPTDEANNFKFGTVGAVALDANGIISAGTSTGGMTNKRYGRIGDSPIIGAGTYANQECGVSATGHGEYFIRAAVTHDICALMQYQGLTINKAADRVIQQKLKAMGGDGGVVGLDKAGNIMMSFNTAGMYRASIDTQGQVTIKIYQQQNPADSGSAENQQE
ncbi:isoaspartyl peptidase/L-asparaginase family protein [Kangiella sp. TOML190]|uniref:isoaspartyl peptidase/L-asparaginase family protein n=1 Tax=Kangiella sp. TOML190 TaxID=2931351 RepID=UPI00203CB347|nr:isoaspartyl peptidase/L-asparaginase [Kangiella sp. TOML190]